MSKLDGADHGGSPFWTDDILKIVDDFLREHVQRETPGNLAENSCLDQPCISGDCHQRTGEHFLKGRLLDSDETTARRRSLGSDVEVTGAELERP